MTDVTTLRELLSRVENAAGPDLELDARLDAALFWDREFGKYPCHLDGHYELADGQVRWLMSDRKYTSSIDAVMDLGKHVIGKRWFCLSGPHSVEGGRWREGEPERYDAIFLGGTDSYAKTPVTALCAAVIRAAIAKVEKEAAGTRH